MASVTSCGIVGDRRRRTAHLVRRRESPRFAGSAGRGSWPSWHPVRRWSSRSMASAMARCMRTWRLGLSPPTRVWRNSAWVNAYRSNSSVAATMRASNASSIAPSASSSSSLVTAAATVIGNETSNKRARREQRVRGGRAGARGGARSRRARSPGYRARRRHRPPRHRFRRAGDLRRRGATAISCTKNGLPSVSRASSAANSGDVV